MEAVENSDPDDTAREGVAVTVNAPLGGVFYNTPSPTDPPFIKVGSSVVENDPVGLIEVMKLFNTIHAGVDGTVTAVLADNAALVKKGEVLVRIRP